MNDFDSEDVHIHQLKIRVQNLKVLLEEAVLKGYHLRMSQLLADIKEAENQLIRQGKSESKSHD